MAHQLTRENHYVPVWYQRRFTAEGEGTLYYLDLMPARQELPDGKLVGARPISKWPPKRCFKLLDLYTTQFGTTLNDEIERYLFGRIDNDGSVAVRAFADGDLSSIHKTFQAFFEYLDAQKLRTPKGLDWIRSQYPRLTQLELMLEMQGLRAMHCNLWAEGVREIVSAEESDVKFIVTDHPVTIYNAAFPPESDACAYPNDPAIVLIGTQTVFPLDANHCLILTNLEYAKNPGGAILTAPRTHARYRAQTIVRTDAFIRTRKLGRDDVIAINYLMKRRARRHLAASDADWLFPERDYSGSWEDISKVLLPKDEIWRFGGEIYVGYKDGSTRYQDQFGRTSRAHELLQKKQRASTPGPNDPCGCGSGRKFKKCCKDVPEQDRPSWAVYSVRERNLILCRAIDDILGLERGKTWDDVRRELSDEQVKRIHETFGSLWPKDTDLPDLLPRPDRNILRGVYVGAIDPRTVAANCTGWLTYVDEVVLPHPLTNPVNIKPEYSPTESPGQFKEQTLKNVLLLLFLQPYIQAGLVHLVPDPLEFSDDFRKTVWEMTEDRTADWKSDEADMQKQLKLAEDDFKRSMERLPELALRDQLRRHSSELTEQQLDLTVRMMKEELAKDPYALLQPMEPGGGGAQLHIMKGFNLEMGMFLAGLTGSVIYTDMRVHWQHLHAHTRAANAPQTEEWQAITDAVNSMAFPIELDSLTARVNGQFGGVRRVLNRIVNAVRDDAKTVGTPLLADLKRAEKDMQREWLASTSPTRVAGRIEVSIPVGGFERNAVRRLMLTFGRAKNVSPIPVALFVKPLAHPFTGVR